MYAYVSLQEANAIATLDLKTKTIVSVKDLGFKDHNVAANSLDALKYGKAELSTQNLYGVYMPDGIITTKIDGKQYLFTAIFTEVVPFRSGMQLQCFFTSNKENKGLIVEVWMDT